jgi:hypothetical protein
MPNDADWKRELAQLAEKLRDPFRMRIAVAAVAVAVMCFAISDPIHGRMLESKRELKELRANVRTAEEVMLLRDHWQGVEDRIVKGDGNDVVVSYLIDIVRGEQVVLSRIDTQPPEKLGPLHSIRVMIDVTGTFSSLMQLLHRLDTDPYLIRVESVAITPPGRDRSDSAMSMVLRVIKEQA